MTLSDSELDELHGVCTTNRRFWQYRGDLDPDDITREAVSVMLRDLADAAGCELLVARDGTGVIVGFAHIMVRHPTDGHPWIELLLVDGRRRRQGHGRAIAAELEERFRRGGEPGVRLGILENNAQAQRFWASLGYREIDRRPDLAKHRPMLVMHKDLRPLSPGSTPGNAPPPAASLWSRSLGRPRPAEIGSP